VPESSRRSWARSRSWCRPQRSSRACSSAPPACKPRSSSSPSGIRRSRCSSSARASIGICRSKPRADLLEIGVVEAAGAEVESGLPAAAALELIHAFSLVHDDLPALDDDAERRGRPSTWAQFGEAAAVLAGDALLTEAFRLALSYPTPAVARELAQATLGMIGGQYLDTIENAPDDPRVHELKTGRLFAAAVGTALWVAEVPEREQSPWRAFGEELGPLFQFVDDILDSDGYARTHGEDGARRLADEAAARAHTRLETIEADTSVLTEIVDALATRTS
jgi:geranylgeranyl pyrophosphate synthase